MKYVIPLLFAFAWIPAANAQTEKPRGSLESRVGRLEGIVEQIDKRLTNIEQDQRETLKRLEALRSEMREEMNITRSEMREEMNITRSEMNTMRGEMNIMRGEMNIMRGEINTLRSEMNTSFRWLVGIIVTLFLGNVGMNWYWNRKHTAAEAPRSVPRREESRPATRPLVDQPLVTEEETPAR